MDNAEFGAILDRLKRSAATRQMADFYLEVERRAYQTKPVVPLATKSPFNKRVFMRDYMRRYRAKRRTDRERTMIRSSP